jgi:hypothetical protein
MKQSRPRRSNGFIPPVSPPQMFLYGKIKSRFHSAQLNYPIETDVGKTRYADIAIFDDGTLNHSHYLIAVEYDGYYHKYKKKQDRIRDAELLRAGWVTVRVNKKNVGEVFDLIEAAIKQCQ